MKRNIVIIASIMIIVSLIYNFKVISNHCGFGQVCSFTINQSQPAKPAHSSLKSTQPSKGQHQLALQLYQAQNQKNPDQFISIIRQASTLPKNEFIQFLNTRHPEVGWTALMIAAILCDSVQFTAIFKALGNVFHNDLQSIFDYLNSRNKEGFSAFQLNAYLGNISCFKPFLNQVITLLKNDKNLLFKTLDASNHWGTSSLSTLAYDSSTEAMDYLIQQAKKQFPPESKYFNNLINSKDSANLTALDYTSVPREQELLIKNGAIKSSVIPANVQKERNLAQTLIQAMHANNLQKMLTIINQAQQEFNEADFQQFLTTKDSDGWTPLMHAAGLGQEKMHRILLHAAYTKLKDNPFLLFDMINYTSASGYSAFSMAVLRRYFTIASYIMEILFHLNINKYWMLTEIGIQSVQSGSNILISAVYNSSDADEYINFVDALLGNVANLYGKDSRPFYLFINQPDFNGFTALDYANTPKMKTLLKKYGAVPGNIVKENFKKQMQAAKNI